MGRLTAKSDGAVRAEYFHALERATWSQLEACRRMARFGTPLDGGSGSPAPRVRDAQLEAWALAQLPQLTEAWREAWVRANPGEAPPE